MQSSAIKFLSVCSVRIILVSTILVGTSLVVMAQDPNRPAAQEPSSSSSVPRPGPSDSATNRDETFELNIVERRYSQDHFEAATAVETNSTDKKLRLQVGVSLASGRIDVLLRNVHGVVRFRGTLDHILQIINDRQATLPADFRAPSPAPPPR